jgi:hypothetical protein
MAGGAELASSRRKFGRRDLWRVALWGMTAAGALAIAVYASATPTGRDRVMLAAVHLREIVRSSEIKPVRPLDAKEAQRLAETVRLLAADRERLLTRVATLEHSIGYITGSIARVEKAVQAASQPPRPEPDAVQADATTAPRAAAEDVTSSVGPPGDVPVPRPAPAGPEAQAPAPNTAKTVFGIDLGGASSIEGLRALWAAARHRNAALLEGLLPIVHLRERPRPAAAELRLVAGPVANAATAARLCAAITAAGAVCQPTLFDGQRLAIR